MTTIKEEYVSFEVAKLLQKNNADFVTDHFYNPNGRALTMLDDRDYIVLGYYKMPSLSMAMKWLREVHKLWIDFSVFCPAPEGMHKQEDCIPRYYYRIKKYNIGYMDFITSDEHILNFPSYEQAVEAAIKYCIENLI